jgi:hypothetical protein
MTSRASFVRFYLRLVAGEKEPISEEIRLVVFLLIKIIYRARQGSNFSFHFDLCIGMSTSSIKVFTGIFFPTYLWLMCRKQSSRLGPASRREVLPNTLCIVNRLDWAFNWEKS